jgi:hypothetical protein
MTRTKNVPTPGGGVETEGAPRARQTELEKLNRQDSEQFGGHYESRHGPDNPGDQLAQDARLPAPADCRCQAV